MSGGLGISYPSNSKGVFPYNFWDDDKFAYHALKANFYQIHNLMLTKKQLVESQRNFPLIDFPKEAEIRKISDAFLQLESKENFKEVVRSKNASTSVV